MAPNNVCHYFKFGYCKHADHCRRRHIREKCENKDCDARTCEKRHPIECKYYRDFKRCKFGSYCLYEHIERNDPVIEELKLVKAKIDAIERKLEEKSHNLIINSSSLNRFFPSTKETQKGQPHTPSVPSTLVIPASVLYLSWMETKTTYLPRACLLNNKNVTTAMKYLKTKPNCKNTMTSMGLAVRIAICVLHRN